MHKFCRYGEFSEYVLPRTTETLKPIYDLTRKGRPFNWGKEQQDSFEEIKCRLIKTPVINMPNKTGRFHLYSDTSKFATGSALYQIQNSKPKLMACVSKRLPEAVVSYSITELDLMCCNRNTLYTNKTQHALIQKTKQLKHEIFK